MHVYALLCNEQKVMGNKNGFWSSTFNFINLQWLFAGNYENIVGVRACLNRHTVKVNFVSHVKHCFINDMNPNILTVAYMNKSRRFPKSDVKHSTKTHETVWTEDTAHVARENFNHSRVHIPVTVFIKYEYKHF